MMSALGILIASLKSIMFVIEVVLMRSLIGNRLRLTIFQTKKSFDLPLVMISTSSPEAYFLRLFKMAKFQ